MPQYGCQKCGSTGSVMEIRQVTINAGLNRELQVAGIIPVQRCLNEKCGQMIAVCNVNVGELAGLIPDSLFNSEPTPPADAEAQEAAKMAELLEMKAKMAELEDPKAQADPPPKDGTAAEMEQKKAETT